MSNLTAQEAFENSQSNAAAKEAFKAARAEEYRLRDQAVLAWVRAKIKEASDLGFTGIDLPHMPPRSVKEELEGQGYRVEGVRRLVWAPNDGTPVSAFPGHEILNRWGI